MQLLEKRDFEQLHQTPAPFKRKISEERKSA